MDSERVMAGEMPGVGDYVSLQGEVPDCALEEQLIEMFDSGYWPKVPGVDEKKPQGQTNSRAI